MVAAIAVRKMVTLERMVHPDFPEIQEALAALVLILQDSGYPEEWVESARLELVGKAVEAEEVDPARVILLLVLTVPAPVVEAVAEVARVEPLEAEDLVVEVLLLFRY